MYGPVKVFMVWHQLLNEWMRDTALHYSWLYCSEAESLFHVSNLHGSENKWKLKWTWGVKSQKQMKSEKITTSFRMQI